MECKSQVWKGTLGAAGIIVDIFLHSSHSAFHYYLPFAVISVSVQADWSLSLFCNNINLQGTS